MSPPPIATTVQILTSRVVQASCCTRETAELLHTPAMYGEEYATDHCGPLSPQCQLFFEAEACLYECSPHAGKFRKHTDCPALANGEGNLWEMFGMPLRASSCDAWWEACRDDLFCVGPSRTFFDREHCDFDDVDNDNYCRYAGLAPRRRALRAAWTDPRPVPSAGPFVGPSRRGRFVDRVECDSLFRWLGEG